MRSPTGNSQLNLHFLIFPPSIHHSDYVGNVFKVSRLLVFIGNCENFVIDVVDEILILFENVIEIYGDIRGASNSFQIEAYEQGKQTEVQLTC